MVRLIKNKIPLYLTTRIPGTDENQINPKIMKSKPLLSALLNGGESNRDFF